MKTSERLLYLLILLLILGCRPSPINKQQAHFDELLRPSDVEQFLDIAAALPGHKLLSNIVPYQPAPKWDTERTLPVRDLVNGELQSLDERWQECAQGSRATQAKHVERVLKRKHISRDRFASLAFAIGIALSRQSVPSDFELERHLKKAQSMMLELRRDNRTFHSLDPEVGHEVLRRAAWLTEHHRGERLSRVPPYNLQLVAHYRDRLREVLPAEFFNNPFNNELDRNSDRALPFEDLAGNEGLEILSFDPSNAIVGSDAIESRKRP